MILGSEVIPTDEYRAMPRPPSQKKGSCFHSLGLESLFQESILPARDCKPVSRQKSYVHKYYFSFFSRFYQLAKTSSDALSHSDASVGVIARQWGEKESTVHTVSVYVNIHPWDLTGFGRL